MAAIFTALTRRKTLHSNEEASKLARVLNLLDLTALGVGSTLGLGVYILAGAVAKTVAGPGVCLSFLIAAVASALAGLCYAEFAARVPKAGSAYVYSYVSVGEFIAYIIGWNLILEYVIGTASVARGLSIYIDELANNTIKDVFVNSIPINVHFLADYPDMLSVLFISLLTILLSIGVKESTILNNIFTLLNLITVSVVIVAGSIKADTHNWSLSKEEVPSAGAGVGGFLPFGVGGVLAGAAKCFYGFVGFDSVATTGEEAKNPQRDIPLSIVISLLIVFLAYFGISTVLTLMWPYYDQNPDAPFPYVFQQVGWITVKWIVTIGAICALCTTLLGAMFPLPRVIYAMASDGLLFKGLSNVNARTKTPLYATLLSGILSGIMAALFNLDQLIDMMSIGTLLAYTIVAVCVLILRYQPDESSPPVDIKKRPIDDGHQCWVSTFKLLFNLSGIKYPNEDTGTCTNWAVAMYSVFGCCFCAFLVHGFEMIIAMHVLYLVVFAMITSTMVLLFVAICRQPKSKKKLTFKVPCVPLLPCVSLLINVCLMLKLDMGTWIRFSIWLIVGFVIYFSYSIRNSNEKRISSKNHTLTFNTNMITEQTKI